MIDFKECSDGLYGRYLKLTNGNIELKVTLDRGPRIIYCALCEDGDNMFHVDTESKTGNSTKAMDDYYGEGRHWHIYGGYRLWMSPESLPETYYPDNDPVKYEVSGNYVTFTPPAQVENGIQTSITVGFKSKSTVTVVNKIRNISNKSKTGAAWGLSAMNKNGIAASVQSHADTELLANRNAVLWSYTELGDERLIIDDDIIAIKQDPECKKTLKVGFNNSDEKICYFYNGKVLVKSYPVDKDGSYPDFSSSAEIYSCAEFTEVESLSALKKIKPGASLTHRETWKLRKCKTPEFKSAQIYAAISKIK